MRVLDDGVQRGGLDGHRENTGNGRYGDAGFKGLSERHVGTIEKIRDQKSRCRLRGHTLGS